MTTAPAPFPSATPVPAMPGLAARAAAERLSVKCRNAFREACSEHLAVREIERAFADQGFDPAPDDAAPTRSWYDPGQRRGTFDRHTHHVNWADAADVRRVLDAFEQILSEIPAHHEDRTERLPKYLGWDGYRVDEQGRIHSGALAISLEQLPLEQLADPAAIREHLDRIVRTADSDPALAISGAKALIEATTKLVLHELGQAVDERADVPELVKQTNKALGLHPEDIAPTAKGAEATKRVLGGLSAIAVGVAELRNLYGPDHGRSTPTTGLEPRHAHLAAGAAATYCRTLLDTLAARRAGTP